MANHPIAIEQPPRVIYLVERLPPVPIDPHPTLLDKVKGVASHALVILGLVILVGASIALAGHVFGHFVIQADTVQLLFMSSIISILSGFHLSKGMIPFTAEITGGPLAVTI